MCAIFRTVSGENKEKHTPAPLIFASADAKHLNVFTRGVYVGKNTLRGAHVEPVRHEAQQNFLKKEASPLF